MYQLCDYMANAYPVFNRDLLITASLLHDVGKTKELSSFPLNDYTDEGQLLGHIIIGAADDHDLAKEIPEFPGGAGKSAGPLYPGTSRRTGIWFPEKTCTGGGRSPESCR